MRKKTVDLGYTTQETSAQYTKQTFYILVKQSEKNEIINISNETMCKKPESESKLHDIKRPSHTLCQLN